MSAVRAMKANQPSARRAAMILDATRRSGVPVITTSQVDGRAGRDSSHASHAAPSAATISTPRGIVEDIRKSDNAYSQALDARLLAYRGGPRIERRWHLVRQNAPHRRLSGRGKRLLLSGGG